MGIINSLLDTDRGVAVAAMVNQPRAKLEVVVKCINLCAEPQELRMVTIIGIYQPVEEDQIREVDVRAQSVLLSAYPEHVATCPACVRFLLKQARPVCKTEEQSTKIASLLTAYPNFLTEETMSY